MKNLNVMLVVLIMTGFMFQSCEKIENPELDTKYVTLRKGIHGNNIYKLPEEGVYYVSEGTVDIFFIKNTEETYKPQFSVGKEANNSIGDTVFLFSKNSEELIRIFGRIEVIN